MIVALDAIVDLKTLFQGIILKIGLVAALIAGLRNAREAESLKKAFQ